MNSGSSIGLKKLLPTDGRTIYNNLCGNKIIAKPGTKFAGDARLIWKPGLGQARLSDNAAFIALKAHNDWQDPEYQKIKGGNEPVYNPRYIEKPWGWRCPIMYTAYFVQIYMEYIYPEYKRLEEVARLADRKFYIDSKLRELLGEVSLWDLRVQEQPGLFR